MSKYTDSPKNFNLIQVTEQVPLSKRAIIIFDMAMNRIGIPDQFHEFIRALSVASRWDNLDDYIELPLGRLAAIVSSTEEDRQRVLNRLKKNCPKFFEWQDKQSFTLIDRVIINERTTHYKTKAKYKLLIYPILEYLWSLPIELNEAGLKRAVNEALKDFPVVEKPKKRGRKRKPESRALTVIKEIDDLIEDTGSPEAGGLYIEEAKKASKSGENVDRLFAYLAQLIAESKQDNQIDTINESGESRVNSSPDF